MNDRLRLIHLSDVHVWRLTANPVHLFSKRILGVADLLRGRARKFRLDRLCDVVDRILSLEPDHVLITGDLTTTALTAEFQDALAGLARLLERPECVTVVPGNHDRYTRGSLRKRKFEEYFGRYMPGSAFPWVRRLDPRTAVLGLDATRSHISARGYLAPAQMTRASHLVEEMPASVDRLIVACHYPAVAPPSYAKELSLKRISNQGHVRRWLNTLPPHVFCCGHVHAAWAFTPLEIPRELSLNAGAPLYRDRKGLRQPGFLEITLEGQLVSAVHHAWNGRSWITVPFVESLDVFGPQTWRLRGECATWLVTQDSRSRSARRTMARARAMA